MRKYKRPTTNTSPDEIDPWAIDPNSLINWNTINADRLVKAFLIAGNDPDSLRLFLDDLLTKSELEQCIKRMYAANLLVLGTPFKFIVMMTGLSTATITRISRQTRHKNGGYCSTLRKLYPQGIRYLIPEYH